MDKGRFKFRDFCLGKFALWADDQLFINPNLESTYRPKIRDCNEGEDA